MDRRPRRVTPSVLRRAAIRRKTRQCQALFYGRRGHWSFHADTPGSAFRWARERWVISGGALLLALLTAIAIPVWARAVDHHTPHEVAHETVALALPPAPPIDPARTPTVKWKTIEVQPGQTLSAIFNNQGLSTAVLTRVLASAKDTGALTNLHPGDKLDFRIDPKGHLKGFRYHTSAATLVTLTISPDNLQSKVVELPVQKRIRIAHGIVDQSLIAAGKKAGMSSALVWKLADVFKHEINFSRDIKQGDRFTVIYDDIYRNGAFVRTGNVLAAEFNNDGHHYTAYRFKKPDGSTAYYDGNGRPLMMALLRTPVSYTRISSRFGMRVDPINHKYQLHTGVDYAAPTGTPVHAAGSGVITIRGWVHGYGKFVAIRDTRKYSTDYAHLSRFAPGLHVGSHVHQGQVIGYVGQTGWATGPNLHYEVRVNGKPENPLTVTMPKPEPLNRKLMADFKQQTAPLIAHIQLIDHRSQRLAGVDNGNHHATTD
jgi:murein DD-endopeptidase MepM/ murein hydrolase activator NlpD